MAQISVRKATDLDEGLVLTPERYDPRVRGTSGGREHGTILTIIADFRQLIVSPEQAHHSADQYLVFDTGDAKDGYLTIGNRLPKGRQALGSSKKVIRCGDVIISRLRPYLRQIAWLDDAVERTYDGQSVTSVVSTEFYVLKSKDAWSISFLVPFLLSRHVQNILVAAQEGGHHPRVPQQTIANLVIPRALLSTRDELNVQVESAVKMTRRSEQQLNDLIAAANNFF